MSANLRTRMSGQSTDTFSGGVTQGIVLARDVTDLNLNLKKTANKDYQQLLYTGTLAVTTGVTISLRSASNTLKDAGNVAIEFAKIFSFMLAIESPAAGKGVRYGPQGVSNAAQLWFSGVTAGEWSFVDDCEWKLSRSAGWAVDSANANLRIYNPSASLTCPFRLWIVGEKP